MPVGGISQCTITFGNGANDVVSATGIISHNTITFGDEWRLFHD
jgi:hypothetical protein